MELRDVIWFRARKKPVVVLVRGPITAEETIHTIEGDHHASVGDYIIRGVKGEEYPIKPDIFRETYEMIEKSPRAYFREKLQKPMGLKEIGIGFLFAGILLMAAGYTGLSSVLGNIPNPCGPVSMATEGSVACIDYSVLIQMTDFGFVLVLAAVVVAVLKGVFNEWRRLRRRWSTAT